MRCTSWSATWSRMALLRGARSFFGQLDTSAQMSRSLFRLSTHVHWSGRCVPGQRATVCQSGAPEPQEPPEHDGEGRDTPTLWTGVNWFCYSAIGLICLTDFTPLGAAILGSNNPGVALSLLQWGAFVLPTLYYCHREGYDLQQTFSLRLPCASWLAGATAAGPALFLAVTVLVRLRLGLDDGGIVAASSSGSPMLATAGQSVGALLLLYVLSPAVAEELLFRGFLLTALRERLGKWDSIAVSGALFALMHLSIEQFFQFCVLGFACGFMCVAADSLAPAVVLHATYNLAAVMLAVSSSR